MQFFLFYLNKQVEKKFASTKDEILDILDKLKKYGSLFPALKTKRYGNSGFYLTIQTFFSQNCKIKTPSCER